MRLERFFHKEVNPRSSASSAQIREPSVGVVEGGIIAGAGILFVASREDQSALIAVIGSTASARRVGTMHATNAAESSTTTAATNEIASERSTPYS